MSAANTNEYEVIRVDLPPFRYMVVNVAGHLHARSGDEVDRFGSEACAHYAARILNARRAQIDSHAPVGCKVMPV